jgi:predicted transcriptional regulator
VKLCELVKTDYMSILSIVESNPEIKKTELKMRAAKKYKVMQKIDKLSESGWIEETTHGRYNVRTYVITEKGKNALEAMREFAERVGAEE